MTFTQAVSSVLGQYAGFRGRARRAEFWWWNLFTLLVGLAVAVTEMSLGIGGETSGPVSTLLALALLLPNVSVSIRRLHDSSRSGWWLLIALVPFAGLIVLVFFFLAPSTAGWNAHGPDPRLPADPGTTAPETFGPEVLGPPTTATGRPTGLPTAAGPPAAPGVPAADGDQAAGAGWTPPGWDLPSAAEPGAGRPAQDRGRQDRGSVGDDPDPDRPQS